MTILITAILLLAFAVFIMSFNIIFRNKPFPDGEIGRNKELRKRGIICAKEEELKLWGRKGNDSRCGTSSCSDCGISNCTIKTKEENK